jgi:SSS family solute:Na+ symporter
VQTLNAFIAPPFAALFLLGLLWRGANAMGAMCCIMGGFFVGAMLKILCAYADMPDWSYPFMNQAGIIWLASVFSCIVGSKLGKPNKSHEEISDILVFENPKTLLSGLGTKWYNSVILWSSVFLVLNVGAMAYFSSLFL